MTKSSCDSCGVKPKEEMGWLIGPPQLDSITKRKVSQRYQVCEQCFMKIWHMFLKEKVLNEL